MKNLKELRALSKAQLQEELLAAKKESFSLRMQKSNGSLEKMHLFSANRKYIAQINTLLTECNEKAS